jgi:hypothetical protein
MTSLLLLLLTTAQAHLYMSTPNPTFEEKFQYDKPAPSQICSLISYTAGSGQEVIPAFNTGLSQKGYKNLKEYADACTLTTSTKICGNTNPLANPIPFPSDNTIRIDIGADHIGPSEIWIDDQLVHYNSGIDGTTIKKTDRSVPMDFASKCPSGNCLVRFVMVALHVSPPEIFDNCVRVGTGGGTVIQQIRNDVVVITSTSKPESTYLPQVQVPVVTAQDPVPVVESTPVVTPESEWSCSPKGLLLRNVNGRIYEFVCAPGTTCRTEGLPYAMCNW